MYKNIVLTALVISSMAMLGGCAPSLKGDVYSREDVRTSQVVLLGTIERLRPVQIEGTKTAIGAGAGAAVGGLVGSSVGDSRGYVAAVIGAVAGGLLGAAAEEGLTRTQGVEITVNEDSGVTSAYVQEISEGEIFRVGDRVAIVSVNGNSRVAHAK